MKRPMVDADKLRPRATHAGTEDLKREVVVPPRTMRKPSKTAFRHAVLAQTMEGQAATSAALARAKPHLFRRYRAAVKRVSPADVQRVAPSKDLTAENLTL